MKVIPGSLHWSNYWQAGQLTSLPQDFKENYSGTIYTEWIKSFKGLLNGNSILDLCAGNCAISLLAATFAEENKVGFSITAIDAADVTKKNILKKYPNQKNNLSKIKLISNCSVENIKLSSSQFDLIVSQYGIEYCDWELAAKQVSRLLKQGGEFAMIAHTGSSEIMKYMQGEETDYDMLNQIGLFKYLNRFANNKASYKVVMKQLGVIQPKIVASYQQKPSQLLQSMLIMLDNIYNTPIKTLRDNRQILKKFYQQHKYAFFRLQDLIRVIKSITMNPDWYQVFIEQGMQLREHKTVMQNNNINSGTLYRFIKL